MINKDIIKDELIKYNDNLVPVIGDELFYVEEANGSCTLQEFIVGKFEMDFPHIAEEISEEEKNTMRKGGYDGLTLLSHCYNVKGNYQEKYINYIENNRKRIKLNRVIKEYLEKSKPQLIITTSSFSLLEEELDYVKKENSFWYGKDDGDKTKYKEKLVPKDAVVYHLFGNAEEPLPDWVYDEISLLEFIHCLHENESSPVGLTNYLKREKKLLLILGCNLPNWFFQFILYPLNKDMITSKRGTRQGFWLRDIANESLALESFLNRINFISIKDVESVVAEVNKQLKSKSTNVNDKEYDIFISHEGQDVELAIEIADYLSSDRFGLRVWLDRNRGHGEVEKGGGYWKRIEEGIQHSRFFMPILTPNYLCKWLLHEYQGTEFGLIKETNMAIKWLKNENNPYCNDKVYSLPIVIQQDCLDRGMEHYPAELFENIQCYFYTKDRNDTFLNHPWQNFRNK